MAANISNLEKYLAGLPLNDELAALRDGRGADAEPVIPPWLPGMAPGRDEDRDLNRDERETLREAKIAGVFTVVGKLQRKALKIHTQSATIESEIDPLRFPQDVASQWAYVKMFRRAIAEMGMLVEAEIGKLEGN
jgi:hypothetical protein